MSDDLEKYGELKSYIGQIKCPECGSSVHQCEGGDPGCVHCDKCDWMQIPDDTYEGFLLAARILHHWESRATYPEGCSEHCPGWAIFQVDRFPGQEIERCDDCNRFKSDDEAGDYVAQQIELKGIVGMLQEGGT